MTHRWYSLALLLIATAAHGAWDGFPFQEASNNWYSIKGFYPLNQILEAIAERDDCLNVRYGWNDGIALIDVYVKGYTGTTDNTVTNNGFTYTNTYITTTNITYTVSPDTSEAPVSDYDTFSVTTEVVYVDATGTGTNTATSRVSLEMISKLRRMMFTTKTETTSGNMFGMTVNTNMASTNYAVGFGAYFATTNELGKYPEEFPHNTLGTVMNYTDIGLYVTATNNGWGFMTVPGWEDYAGFVYAGLTNAYFYAHNIEVSNSVVMGRVTYDGSWTFADRSTFMSLDLYHRYLADTNAHLVVTSFQTNTPSMTVTVNGSKQGTGLVARTDSATEDVVMGGFAAALSNDWVDITGMTVAGTAYTGDVVEVVFDGPITVYSIEYYTGKYPFTAYKDVVNRLYFEQLNEFYHLLNACRWSSDRTAFNVTSDSTFGVNNRVMQQGVSNTSWTNAIARAQGGDGGPDVSVTTSSKDMVRGTAGVYNSGGPSWVATREYSAAYLEVDNIPTDVSHAIDMYLTGTKYLGIAADFGINECQADAEHSVFTDYGDGYSNHYFIVEAGDPASENNTGTEQSTNAYGAGSFPTNWCSEPVAGSTNSANGYRLEFNDMYLLRWDGSNGLAYK